MPQLQGSAIINIGYFNNFKTQIANFETSFTAGAHTILAEANLSTMFANPGAKLTSISISAGVDLNALMASTDIPQVMTGLQSLLDEAAGDITAIESQLAGTIQSMMDDLNKLLADAQAQIQDMINTVMADIQGAINGIRAEIAKITPLATIPTDLGSVISWITSAAQPYIQAIVKLNQQISQVMAQVAALQASLQAALNKMPIIHITIPPVI